MQQRVLNLSIAAGLLALLFAIGPVFADDASAAGAPAGEAELKLLDMIFTGNIGLTIGLALAIMGVFQFVKGTMASAIILFVLGVTITLLPGIYNGLRTITCTLVPSLGGHCGTTT